MLFNALPVAIGLQQRIAKRYGACLAAVAAKHIAKADDAGCKLDCGARDGGFADIERRAIAANAAA